MIDSATDVLHATLVFERKIPAPPEKVFAALADPQARIAWGAPSDTAVLIYDESDFREGGRDCFRCGAKADPTPEGEGLGPEHNGPVRGGRRTALRPCGMRSARLARAAAASGEDETHQRCRCQPAHRSRLPDPPPGGADRAGPRAGTCSSGPWSWPPRLEGVAGEATQQTQALQPRLAIRPLGPKI